MEGMKYELGITKTNKGNIVFTKANTKNGPLYYLFDTNGIYMGEITKEKILQMRDKIVNLTVTSDNRLIYKKEDKNNKTEEIVKDWFNYYGPDGKAIINRVLREYEKSDLKELKKYGYDGIIVKNAPVGIKDKRTIQLEVIVFESNQIKYIYNHKPTDSPNIYDGCCKDITVGEINAIYNAQKEYFKNSKILDKQGRLKVMHHCTNADFEIFEKKCIGEGFGSSYGEGFYFSSEVLSEYGKDIPVYLNVTKPYVINNVNNLREIIAFLYTCGVK